MKKLVYILLLSFCFISCEEVIDLELPETESKLVIEASFNKDYGLASCSNCWIKLTLSSPFFDENIKLVSDAEVEIIDITNNFAYDFIYDSNGGYYTSELGFIPEFNTEYMLRVAYNNETYESTIEQLIPSSPIDSLEQGDGTLFEGDEKEVIISYTDVANRNDFYLIELGDKSYLTSKDEFYQGNPFSFSYFYDNESEGEELFIKLYGISERYYNYMNILLNQVDNDGNPFGTVPTSVQGNITNITNSKNQPLGYFTISEFDVKSILIE